MYKTEIIKKTSSISKRAKLIEEKYNEMEKQEPVEQEAPQKSFDEMTFEEALEASLKNLNTGEKVKGVVVSIAPNEIQVDIGTKQTGFVKL